MIHIPTPRASGHCPCGSRSREPKKGGSRNVSVNPGYWHHHCQNMSYSWWYYIYIWDDIRKIWYTIIWYLLSMVYAVDIRKIWYDICKIWYTTLLLYGLYSMFYAVWYLIYDIWYFIWGDMMWYGWYYMKWYDIHIYL